MLSNYARENFIGKVVPLSFTGGDEETYFIIKLPSITQRHVLLWRLFITQRRGFRRIIGKRNRKMMLKRKKAKVKRKAEEKLFQDFSTFFSLHSLSLFSICLVGELHFHLKYLPFPKKIPSCASSW